MVCVGYVENSGCMYSCLQEDKTRVEIFREYARKQHESVWGPFLSMLTRTDAFIVNQVELISLFLIGSFL